MVCSLITTSIEGSESGTPARGMNETVAVALLGALRLADLASLEKCVSVVETMEYLLLRLLDPT